MQTFDRVSDVVVDVLRHKIHFVIEEELRQIRQQANLWHGKKVHQLHHVGTFAVVVAQFGETDVPTLVMFEDFFLSHRFETTINSILFCDVK